MKSFKKSLDALVKAIDIISKQAEKLPKEYQFLANPRVKDELKQLGETADKIMAAAHMLGEEIGVDRLDEEKLDELVNYLVDQGIIGSSPIKEGAVSSEGGKSQGEPQESPEGAQMAPEEEGKESAEAMSYGQEGDQAGSPEYDMTTPEQSQEDEYNQGVESYNQPEEEASSKIKRRALKAIESLLDD